MAEPEKRRGRPALPEHERKQPVCIRFAPAVHDLACQKAVQRGVTLSEIVQKAVQQYVASS